MKNVKIVIGGMSCGHCESHVRNELEKVDGVKRIEVSAKTGDAHLEIEEFVKEGDLKKAIKEAGYEPVKIVI